MSWRPLTIEDAPTVAAIAGADEAAFHGRPSRIQASDVEAWWERADLASSSWLYEEAGIPLAFGWFELYGEIGTFVGMVAQGAKGRGLGAALADRGEAQAREANSPKIHTIGLAEDSDAATLFTGRGFHEVRRFYEMAIELGGPPPEPALADGLVLDEVGDGDMRAFYDALGEAFQDHWEWHPTPYDEWLETRRGQHHDDDGPLWFVIRDGDEIAGTVRNEANRNGGGYVGAIGVRRPWRGRGIAKALLHRTFQEFYSRGVTRVTLGVDAQSPTGATHLYERVGMEVESCMVVYEKAPS
jgi:GNAT superfamily N-acetyltransferase